MHLQRVTDNSLSSRNQTVVPTTSRINKKPFMKFTQKNLKTCFLCKCTCCFTIIFILPCRSALLYKKETTNTKRGELHQDDLDKCNKFPNKIRIADRKSTTIVHVCEGSPRAALVNISASYTGFTQLFTFQYSNSSLITCYPHPTPKTHSPNNTGFCTLQST